MISQQQTDVIIVAMLFIASAGCNILISWVKYAAIMFSYHDNISPSASVLSKWSDTEQKSILPAHHNYADHQVSKWKLNTYGHQLSPRYVPRR